MDYNIKKEDIDDLGEKLLKIKDKIPSSDINIRKCEKVLSTKKFVNNHFNLLQKNISNKGFLNPLYTEFYVRLNILHEMFK